MIVKQCKEPNCRELAILNSWYCPKHKATSDERRAKHNEQWNKEHKAFQNATRSTELYQTYRWRQLRGRWLAEHPECARCGSRDRVTVDHIVPHRGYEGLFWDEGNLQTLCAHCHSAKTAMENADRRTRRRRR